MRNRLTSWEGRSLHSAVAEGTEREMGQNCERIWGYRENWRGMWLGPKDTKETSLLLQILKYTILNKNLHLFCWYICYVKPNSFEFRIRMPICIYLRCSICAYHSFHLMVTSTWFLTLGSNCWTISYAQCCNGADLITWLCWPHHGKKISRGVNHLHKFQEHPEKRLPFKRWFRSRS